MKKFSILQRFFIPLALIGILALCFLTERAISHNMQGIEADAYNETEELGRLLTMAENLVGERVHASMRLLKQRSEALGVPAIGGTTHLGTRTVPDLYLGSRSQTNNFGLVDGVTEIGGGTATLFVKDGDDFIRVSTNITQDNGARALGTHLDRGGRAYAAIMRGQPFYGVVSILGQPYITGYEPMRNMAGEIIGIWFVGYKIDLEALDLAIKKWNFLDTGFAAVLDNQQRIRFVSERLDRKQAASILSNHRQDWVIVKRDIPGWHFQTVIAYPWKEAALTGFINSFTLLLISAGVGLTLIVMTLYIVRRYVLAPLGEDPEIVTALVQRIAAGDFEKDGIVARPGTLMSNVLIMRRKLRETVSTLRDNAERMSLSASVFEHANDGIFVTDRDQRIVEVNPAFSRCTGYSRDDALGRTPQELGFAVDDETIFQQLHSTGEWRGETWNRRSDGEKYPASMDTFVVRDDKKQISHYVGVFSDITSYKEHQQNLEHLAYHDPLTQLPNRTLLGDRLQQALARASRSGELLSICYFDLDGFKPVNDTLGHEAGDRLLVQLAARVRTCLRESDTIARLGGDEFAVLLCDLKSIEESQQTLDRLLNTINTPFLLGEKPVRVSASIGYTIFPIDDSEPDTLLRHADQAMYQAKLNGGSGYHMFDAEHDRHTRSQRQIREQVEAALRNGEFVFHYQPKVNMRKGTVVGVEALVRWQDPELGLRYPADFLSVVENTDFAITLGEWGIHEALRQIGVWQSQGIDLSISVNIAARHMMQPDFAKRLSLLLQAFPKIPPSKLELEITESAAIEDIAGVAKIINSCKLLGIGFALDDFGVGYSSLTYLRRLPVETIKIDQSFVRDMLHDHDDLSLIAGVISLSREFERQVVAEGVETAEHGLQLLKMGCQLAQGYGIARPMPADKIPAWVRGYRPDDSWNEGSF